MREKIQAFNHEREERGYLLNSMPYTCTVYVLHYGSRQIEENLRKSADVSAEISAEFS